MHPPHIHITRISLDMVVHSLWKVFERRKEDGDCMAVVYVYMCVCVCVCVKTKQLFVFEQWKNNGMLVSFLVEVLFYGRRIKVGKNMKPNGT